MKKFHLPILFLLLLFSTSCLQDECSEGTVKFTNNSTNPYNLLINGEFKEELPGGSFYEIELPEGQHNARAEQVSGFLLFPTVKEKTLNVFGCQETQWVFPF